MARPVHQRPGERGFALLLVFVMAAAISIGLYMELPRSVFESQRAKEELLFDRGEQYKMGIKRYYTKFQRYPASMEQLEQTNGTRYLRRKYIDPFTGKDDWKILKFGANGEIEGSVHNKKKTGLEKEAAGTGSVSAGPSLGDQTATGADGERLLPNGESNNPALNRRPSDTGIGAQLANPNGAGAAQNGAGGTQQNGQYPASNQNQLNQLSPNNLQQYPNQQQANQQLPNQQLPGAAPNPYGNNGNPTFTGPQQNSGQVPQQVLAPGQMTQQQYQQQQLQQLQQQMGSGLNGQVNRLPNGAIPGQIGVPGQIGGNQLPGLPGQPANSQNGGQIGTPLNSNGLNNNGQNPAAAMLNQLLTQPRTGVQVGQLTGGALAGAMPSGIAGVVSKHKGQGIRVLEEKTKIQEWEFIYDVRKDKSLQKGAMAPQQSGKLPGSGLTNSSGMNSNKQ